ncbi:ATP-dependent DNA helicase PIF1-like [Watersipora subatra]|uniref:ATP-dependent DNA helicase PIF1-like n=1 Tax=Watersipora subatra TaxID=2589382 RepID=UPI00355BEE0C
MAHKETLEALDRTLKDLYNSDKLMGGVCVILAGDFCQILPVIPRGTPADKLKACLKDCYIWHCVEVCKLTTNMRVHMGRDDALGEFSAQLLNISEGKLPVNNGLMFLPDSCGFIVDTEDNLLQKVYQNIHENYLQHQWLKKRVILAPKNATVDHIHQLLLEKIPGTTTSFLSMDCVVEENDSVNYPTKFLNSLQPASMPPHNLQLCLGAPVMLLRNLDLPRLCNGTRLIIKNLSPNLICATVLTGAAMGEQVFIPRIPLIPTNVPFQLKRIQFPVRLSFALTINKSQGQTLKTVGIHLLTPCSLMDSCMLRYPE